MVDGSSSARATDVELRPVRPADRAQIYQLVQRSRAHLAPWMPWVHGDGGIADTDAFLQAAKTQEEAGRGFQAGIWWRESLAGVIGYHPIDWPACRVDLGYWLGTGFPGHGLATRSAAAMVDYAFVTLGLRQVGIRAAEANRRSQLVAERLGFQRTGVVSEGEWFIDHWVALVVYQLDARRWPIRRAQLQEPPATIRWGS